MVATAAQIAANRANALRSTGPSTPEGKAASSRNTLTHGTHASDDTILATTPNVYLDGFRARFQPADALEAHLVEHLAVLALRRDRLEAAMDALLELNERHALTEHLHERYGVNTPNARIPGQPSWQAAMRRYDGNTYVDPRYPEPVSDPALDPDPLLCSLAYTLSGSRAAALFRHEASVDRRFHTALKELTAIQAQRRAAAATEGKTPPAVPPHGPSFLHAVDRYLRATATPTDPWFDPTPTSAPAPLAGSPAVPADPTPTPRSPNEAPVGDQTQSAAPAHNSSASPEQNEPGAADEQKEPNPLAATAHHCGATTSPMQPDGKIEPDAGEPVRSAGAAFTPTLPDRTIKPNPADYLPVDEPPTFLSVLPRHPDEPSSIPAHWPGALLPNQ